MQNTWLASRKDIFLKGLIQDFFEAKVCFDSLCDTYRQSSTVPYRRLDTWIGTETKKGSLWNLKDQCHRLFRNAGSKNNPYEYLFDWTIGSIFHEAIKLKEDAYQLESYKPLLELEVYKKNEALTKIIHEYFPVIENARSNLKDELTRIGELFSKAILLLKEIIPLYRDNILLVRFLLDTSRKVPENLFGKDSFGNILHRMFPEGLPAAYLAVAEKCITGGRPGDAVKYLKRVLQIDHKNDRALGLLKQLEALHDKKDIPL